MSVVKNKRTQEEREYWAYVEEVAAEVAKWPCWMKGGHQPIGSDDCRGVVCNVCGEEVTKLENCYKAKGTE